MTNYIPDRWMVVRIHAPTQVLYKVFAAWRGGYAGADSWKLNSGIVRATFRDPYWEFDGSSGSVYRCHSDSYGNSLYGGGILDNLISQAKAQGIQIDVLDQNTAWDQLEYDPLAQWVESGVRDA
jgi:hypothetical protein